MAVTATCGQNTVRHHGIVPVADNHVAEQKHGEPGQHHEGRRPQANAQRTARVSDVSCGALPSIKATGGRFSTPRCRESPSADRTFRAGEINRVCQRSFGKRCVDMKFLASLCGPHRRSGTWKFIIGRSRQADYLRPRQRSTAGPLVNAAASYSVPWIVPRRTFDIRYHALFRTRHFRSPSYPQRATNDVR